MTPYEKHIQHLKDKWNISELQIEGMEKPAKRTLADDIRIRNVIEAKGSRLVTTIGTYRERPFRAWLEIRL